MFSCFYTSTLIQVDTTIACATKHADFPKSTHTMLCPKINVFIQNWHKPTHPWLFQVLCSAGLPWTTQLLPHAINCFFYCYTQSSNIQWVCLKVAGAEEQLPFQSDSDQDLVSSPWPTPLHPACAAEVPAAFPRSTTGERLGIVQTPPPSPPTASPRSPAMLPHGGAANIPLQSTQNQRSLASFDIGAVVPILSACIDMSVAII